MNTHRLTISLAGRTLFKRLNTKEDEYKKNFLRKFFFLNVSHSKRHFFCKKLDEKLCFTGNERFSTEVVLKVRNLRGA